MRDQNTKRIASKQRPYSRGGIGPKALSHEFDVSAKKIRAVLRVQFPHKPNHMWLLTESQARQARRVLTRVLQKRGPPC